MTPRIIIFSAPSGAGKSTLISRLTATPEVPPMSFSISATSRPPRGAEQNGREYYFLSPDEFRARIAAGDFIEYEEVYPGRFYGTLRSEIDRILASGHNVILDLDVKGALRVKELYGSRALALFVQPPSIQELRRRLEGRATDSPADIDTRVARAAFEIAQAPLFDAVIVNDDLDRAAAETASRVTGFLS